MGKVHMGKSDRQARPAKQAESLILPSGAPEVITEIQYVDRIVEVPVEKIVMVDRPVETTVERIVEKPVEVIKEVEKIVYIPEIKEVVRFVDRPVEKIVFKEVVHIDKTLDMKKTNRTLESKLRLTRIALAVSLVLTILAFAK